MHPTAQLLYVVARYFIHRGHLQLGPGGMVDTLQNFSGDTAPRKITNDPSGGSPTYVAQQPVFLISGGPGGSLTLIDTLNVL